MATIVEDWLAYLEQAGWRVTWPTRAVVEIAATSTRALRPDQLLVQVRARHAGVGPQTVSRTLARLTALGLLQRVSDGAGRWAYLAAGGDCQPLVICERCGEAEYVECEGIIPLLEDIRERTGFALRNSTLQLFGLCGRCQPITDQRPDTHPGSPQSPL